MLTPTRMWRECFLESFVQSMPHAHMHTELSRTSRSKSVASIQMPSSLTRRATATACPDCAASTTRLLLPSDTGVEASSAVGVIILDLAEQFHHPLKFSKKVTASSHHHQPMGTSHHVGNHTHRFQCRRAAFFIFNNLKSKTGLMVARAAALRTNINIDGRVQAARSRPRNDGELPAKPAPPTSFMLLPPTFTSQ